MDNHKSKGPKLTKLSTLGILAAEEILALTLRYHENPDQTYTFECDGTTVTATYNTATLCPRPVNFYRIRLIAPLETVANGPAFIIDRHGRRQAAGASTEIGETENHIIVETRAVKNRRVKG